MFFCFCFIFMFFSQYQNNFLLFLFGCGQLRDFGCLRIGVDLVFGRVLPFLGVEVMSKVVFDVPLLQPYSLPSSHNCQCYCCHRCLSSVAGMVFAYGICFLLITAAEAVAISFPYFISYRYFLRKIRVRTLNVIENCTLIMFHIVGEIKSNFCYCLFYLMCITQRWLDNRPREVAIVRLAGDWLHQFQAVVLI
ncbi:hypothetical protein RND81_04G039400 [Saponaria officinalis]|uniref:Uncharacterized protein n=1 Tax=Saponaria officinalis TaxID=3572 RepID=A0AAW1LGT7_SAPOF